MALVNREGREKKNNLVVLYVKMAPFGGLLQPAEAKFVLLTEYTLSLGDAYNLLFAQFRKRRKEDKRNLEVFHVFNHI